jgi:hypothetical protein
VPDPSRTAEPLWGVFCPLSVLVCLIGHQNTAAKNLTFRAGTLGSNPGSATYQQGDLSKRLSFSVPQFLHLLKQSLYLVSSWWGLWQHPAAADEEVQTVTIRQQVRKNKWTQAGISARIMDLYWQNPDLKSYFLEMRVCVCVWREGWDNGEDGELTLTDIKELVWLTTKAT